MLPACRSLRLQRLVTRVLSYVCVAHLLAIPCSALADESDEATKKAESVKTQRDKDIDESLERYKVYVGGDTKPLKPISALDWNNPLAGGAGRTVLFLQNGQARSVCCIWASTSNQLYHEFGSFSRTGLRGELDGNDAWELGATGVKFRAIPESDEPAADRRRRLLQMKNLMRRFNAVELENRQREPDRVQLRLLARPLYRYEQESDQILDGAVFGYVHTTDPEALVVLEAVRSGEKLRWEYTFLRRTTLPVMGELDGVEVWNTDKAGYGTFNQIRYRP